MSALFTALVESETKETLTAGLLEHRSALRKTERFLRDLAKDAGNMEAEEMADEAKAVLDTLIFKAAREPDHGADGAYGSWFRPVRHV